MAVSDLLDEREAVPENIGATLREAREAAGYSIADVAERLRLSRHLVENLEAERFELFPVSVFLRGYLTSYARLLGIDSEPLIEAYDRRGFGPPQLHSQDSARTSSRGSEFTVTITTLIVIAVLIILSALWWREQWTEDAGLPGVTVERPGEEDTAGAMDEGPGIPAEPMEPAEPAVPAVPAGETAPEEPPDPEAATDDPAVEPPPVRAGAGPSAGDAPGEGAPEGFAPPAREETEGPAETSPVPAEATQAPAETAPAPDAVADTDADAGEPAETASTPAPDTGTGEPVGGAPGEGAEPAPAAAEGAAPGPAAGAPGELATLLIRINEDCWLMIRDADQRLVYRDLASAGTVLDLSVAPPVRIVAGYAEGIELEYNGEPIDLSPWVEQDTGTARFRLGS